MTKTCKHCGSVLPEEKTYRVKWEIDVEASTPQEAAKKARQMQVNEGSWANVFDVVAVDAIQEDEYEDDPYIPWERVDLLDIEGEDK